MSGNHHKKSFIHAYMHINVTQQLINRILLQLSLQQVLKCQSREIFIQFKVLLKVLYSTVNELRSMIIIVVNINYNLTFIEGLYRSSKIFGSA